MPYKDASKRKPYWRKRNLSRTGKDAQLKVRYGITLTEYEELFREQKGLCAICGKPETDPRRKYLSVDHNHTTKVVRGLCCSRCNLFLGHLERNFDVLEAALEYLKTRG